MIVLYSAAMTLLIAQTFGLPGYALWGACWAVVVFRHASKPRNRGAQLTTGERRSS